MPSRKAHKLDQYQECKDENISGEECYEKIHQLVDSFIHQRNFMWPTFAGNGFDVADVVKAKK